MISKEQRYMYNLRYRLLNSDKTRVHNMIHKHMELYPLDNECIFCNSTYKLERAHLDYNNDGHNYVTACHGCNMVMEVKEMKGK